MEVGGTSPYFDHDHYESTHYECDNNSPPYVDHGQRGELENV